MYHQWHTNSIQIALAWHTTHQGKHTYFENVANKVNKNNKNLFIKLQYNSSIFVYIKWHIHSSTTTLKRLTFTLVIYNNAEKYDAILATHCEK